jgi:D-beta-D-heptose 7-phosphate kinase/D-beta-D-heptose 1-phosphate adenosyltransferase
MKILVIGEICIDEFIYGKCTRLNPEAPTPVFIEKRRSSNKGMAGNVAENLSSLGGFTIFRAHQKNPIKKIRYVDETSNYILLRVDSEEDIDRINIDNKLIEQIKTVDLVVISDYNKGFLYPEDLRLISDIANASIIDTKKPITFEWAEKFNIIKMNNGEWENPAHDSYAKMVMSAKTIITQGKDGAILNGKSFKGIEVDVMDVAGAGDSFLAGFVHKWLSTGDIEKGIEFANEIAAYVVKKRGVVNQIIF